jgi:HK97 family phage major capsid protein
MNLNELKAQRHDLFTLAESQISAAKKSGKDLAGAELSQYNTVLAQMKQLDGEIERLASYGAGNANFFLSGPGRPAAHSGGLKSRLREIYNRATMAEREQIDAFAAYLGDVRAAADLKPSGDGAYAIPSFIVPVMERDYSAFAPVASVARLWSTDTGADTTFPVLSDSESAVQLDAAATTGADATVSGDTPPTDLTGPTLKAWKVSSKPVFIPRETFTDSPIDIISEVVGALLARIIRFENLKRTKGNGTTESEGFLTNCASHAAGAVALDLDICLDLAYAVPQLYRSGGVYMMSDTTAKYLRKLKTGITGDKRQLWADADATKGTPATLHGYPVYINNDMDSVAADGTFAAKSPVAFGNFSKFVVRQAENNQPYAYRYSVPAKDGAAVILFRRSDSKLLVPEAVCKLVVA